MKIPTVAETRLKLVRFEVSQLVNRKLLHTYSMIMKVESVQIEKPSDFGNLTPLISTDLKVVFVETSSASVNTSLFLHDDGRQTPK